MIAQTLKDKLVLILTVFLVVCALVITSAVIFLVVSRCPPWSGRAAAPAGAHALPVSHRLPGRAADLLRTPDPVRSVLSTTVRGLPLVPEFATVVRIAGRDRLLLPVLMQESALPVRAAMALANPLKWREPGGFSECTAGRRSLWYMPVGSTMLYGVLLDPQMDARRVGLGFVLVKRLDESRYDVLLEDSRGATLFAARGRLRRLNPAIGQGTLEPEGNQEEVRRLYGARWTVGPEAFLLFSVSDPR